MATGLGGGWSQSGTSSGTPPIGGGGTFNYLAKFTPDGSTIGNSLAFDNGASVGIGTAAPAASALLDMSSTTQGFLAPRMTQAQRDAIIAPAMGLFVYNTTASKFNFWDGVSWKTVESSAVGFDTLQQVLSAGNTTGGTNISVTSGDLIQFNVGSGGTLNSASTGAARTWLLPDQDGTLAVLASPPFTGTPTAPTAAAGTATAQLATTAFVTSAISDAIAGVDPAVAVTVASNATLPNAPTYNNGVAGVGAFITTATLNTPLVVDSATPTLNQRVLVKNEGDGGGLGASRNGVYFVSQLAALGLAWILTRALDYDTPANINNTGAIPVVSGTVNSGSSWLLTSSVTTVGTDALTYTQFTYPLSQVVTLTGAQALSNKSYSGSTLVLSSFMNEAQGADIISAATTNIGAATGNYVNITGTTTITAFDTVQAGTRRILNFNGILTLSYNATSLILPGAANIITAVGDTATVVSLGSGNWICTNYQKANGNAVVGGSNVGSSLYLFNNFT